MEARTSIQPAPTSLGAGSSTQRLESDRPDRSRRRRSEAGSSTQPSLHLQVGGSVFHQATKGGFMPLKANVGLSRKVADNNYGSRGASINIELELDSSLIGEPAKFQEKIRQVYGLARTALSEELNGHANNGNGTNSDT